MRTYGSARTTNSPSTSTRRFCSTRRRHAGSEIKRTLRLHAFAIQRATAVARVEADEETMPNEETVDIVIIGSGMGGATCAAGLAPSGARILILERGVRLRDSAEARDARAIFQRGVFRPQEMWLDGAGRSFNPGNYYYVGGNSKLYGAVLLRYRAQDFEPVVYRDGATPGWPFSYEELEPW